MAGKIKKCIIYALVDPREPAVFRYLGVTHHSLRSRLWGHLEEKAETAKALWIRSLLADGIKPEIVEVHAFDSSDDVAWRTAEKRFIEDCKKDGHPLLNSMTGGAGRSFPKNRLGRPRLPRKERKACYTIYLRERELKRVRGIAKTHGLSLGRLVARVINESAQACIHQG